jgi:uroporphyrinogen decarboxylase
MRGPEGVFMNLATNPQDVKKFVEMIGDYMIEIGKRQLDFDGVEGLFIWGDVAYKNGMLFSPKIWKEVFYPVVKRMCTEFHNYKEGIPLVYHGCGDSRSILDDLIEAGIDAYHTLEVVLLIKFYG